MRKELPKDLFHKFESKVGSIIRKAKKLGVTPPSYQVLREFEKEVSRDGKRYFYDFVEIELESNLVMLNGWDFVATIDHRENGNILFANPKYTDQFDISGYYKAASHCDHCSKQRSRKNTYLMTNGEGNFKQVGSSCIKDFIGHPSAEYYAELYGFIREFEEEKQDEESLRSFRGREAIEVRDVLEAASMMIRLHGYRSAQMMTRTTSGMVKYWMDTPKDKYEKELKEAKPEITEADKKAAESAMALALSFPEYETKSNMFKNNLKTLVATGHCFDKDIGMLCYLPEMNMKTMQARMEKEAAEKEAKKSEFTGEVGKRMTFQVEYLKAIAYGTSTYGYHTQEIVLFMFKCGNDILTWKTTNELPESPEGLYEITGTVKAHTEYKGVKQTELTRCKVVPKKSLK